MTTILTLHLGISTLMTGYHRRRNTRSFLCYVLTSIVKENIKASLRRKLNHQQKIISAEAFSQKMNGPKLGGVAEQNLSYWMPCLAMAAALPLM
jgi:hypothetical protein